MNTFVVIGFAILAMAAAMPTAEDRAAEAYPLSVALGDLWDMCDQKFGMNDLAAGWGESDYYDDSSREDENRNKKRKSKFYFNQFLIILNILGIVNDRSHGHALKIIFVI